MLKISFAEGYFVAKDRKLNVTKSQTLLDIYNSGFNIVLIFLTLISIFGNIYFCQYIKLNK